MLLKILYVDALVDGLKLGVVVGEGVSILVWAAGLLSSAIGIDPQDNNKSTVIVDAVSSTRLVCQVILLNRATHLLQR